MASASLSRKLQGASVQNRTKGRNPRRSGALAWRPQVRLRRWGRTVMDNLSIRDLLLLTCMGSFIACATYAVTLLH